MGFLAGAGAGTAAEGASAATPAVAGSALSGTELAGADAALGDLAGGAADISPEVASPEADLAGEMNQPATDLTGTPEPGQATTSPMDGTETASEPQQMNFGNIGKSLQQMKPSGGHQATTHSSSYSPNTAIQTPQLFGTLMQYLSGIGGRH